MNCSSVIKPPSCRSLDAGFLLCENSNSRSALRGLGRTLALSNKCVLHIRPRPFLQSPCGPDALV